MRILYLGNNELGLQTLRWLKEQGEEIVALAVHTDAQAKCKQEIIATCGLAAEHVFEGPALGRQEVLQELARCRPDIGVSVMFGCILRPPLLSLLPAGCINLHSAYLPYNRGSYPNIWTIVDGTPAGVTMHYIDEGVDTGDIIAQREIEVQPTDTGETMYHKLQSACIELFQQTWPRIRAGTAKRTPQPPGAGTCHYWRNVDRIDEVDLERTYKAKDLINILRARTFQPYPGAYFLHRGRKVYMRIGFFTKDENHGH